MFGGTDDAVDYSDQHGAQPSPSHKGIETSHQGADHELRALAAHVQTLVVH